MTSLTVDSRLPPLCPVGVRRNIVVLRQLAHVTPVTGRIERQHRVFPVERGVSRDNMPHHAGRGIVPLLRFYIERRGQYLQFPALKGSEKIIYVFACLINSLANKGKSPLRL